MSWLFEEGLKDSRSLQGADILGECSNIMGFSPDSRTRQRFMVLSCLPQRNYLAPILQSFVCKSTAVLKISPALVCETPHGTH